jgi:hypothetical protein
VKRSVTVSLEFVFCLLSYLLLNQTTAQNNQTVRYFVEGNPVITVNSVAPALPLPTLVAEAVLLNPGDKLCYPKAQDDTERVWLVYANRDQMPLEPSLEYCFTVPKPTFWSVLVSIFTLNEINAIVVEGRGEVRGSKDGSVDIVLPSNILLPNITLWVKGGPGPFVLRLSGSEQQMIEPTQVIDGVVRDEVAFTLPAQILQQATRVEIFKGDGSLFYCGKVIVSSDVEMDTTDLLEEARILSLKNDWQLTPAIYSYLTTALETGQVAEEARGDFEQMLTGMREFMMATYSVDSCQGE